MVKVYADRVKETTTTTGTGTIDLDGAITGFQSFVSGIGSGNTCDYTITDDINWEVGTGTVTDAAPDTLSRTTIHGSSNGGAVVTWGVGIKDVFCTLAATNVASFRGYIDGLILSNNGTDAAHDIDISVGVARDDSDSSNIELTTSLTKRIDDSWAVGTNNGGLDTGTVSIDTWYHIWIVRRSDTGVVDALFSESATSPTMPTDYDQKRRIGAVLTDGSANILAFTQNGDIFRWTVRVLDVDTSTPGTSAVTAAMSVPLGIKIDGMFLFSIFNNANGFYVLTSLDESDTTPSETHHDLVTDTSEAARPTTRLTQQTNTSRQIRYRSTDSSVSYLRIFTLGWVDSRGRNV